MEIPIFTREERKIIDKMREERSWDADVRALIAIFDAAQPRFDARLADLDLLVEAGNILFKKVKVNAIYRDLFGSGNIGVCRRSGVFGVGPDLRTAVRDLQKNEKVDKKPLDKRGFPPSEESLRQTPSPASAFRDTYPETSNEPSEGNESPR